MATRRTVSCDTVRSFFALRLHRGDTVQSDLPLAKAIGTQGDK